MTNPVAISSVAPSATQSSSIGSASAAFVLNREISEVCSDNRNHTNHLAIAVLAELVLCIRVLAAVGVLPQLLDQGRNLADETSDTVAELCHQADGSRGATHC